MAAGDRLMAAVAAAHPEEAARVAAARGKVAAVLVAKAEAGVVKAEAEAAKAEAEAEAITAAAIRAVARQIIATQGGTGTARDPSEGETS